MLNMRNHLKSAPAGEWRGPMIIASWLSERTYPQTAFESLFSPGELTYWQLKGRGSHFALGGKSFPSVHVWGRPNEGCRSLAPAKVSVTCLFSIMYAGVLFRVTSIL
jgi:hypothetical protein